MTFDQFVDFFFARAVVPDDRQFHYFSQDLAGRQYDESVPSTPAIVVAHMTRLFSEFGRVAPRFSLAQIDQGVWGVLGENLRLYELLWDSSISLPDRVRCKRSMYSVFSDFVAKSGSEVLETGLYMWWDLILHGFWFQTKLFEQGAEKGDLSKLGSESRVLLDAMFETLTRILELPDSRTKDCALHGFGHLHHPSVRETVQEFIDNHRSELTGDRLRWVEACRDGTVM
jgi:hypothetical protein